MLRTIFQTQPLRGTLRKAVRLNVTRCLSTELTRRKRPNIFLLSSRNRVLETPQWRTQVRHYADLPTHSKVNLPALSPTMENGSIISWEKKEGDELNEGDLLCEIETDKATMGFETPEEGFLAKILIPAGTKGVPVGKLLCIIVDNKDDVAAFKDFKDDSKDPPPKQAEEDKPEEKTAEKQKAPAKSASEGSKPAGGPAPAATTKAAPAPPSDGGSGDRVYASPMAKRLAEQRKIRLEGPGSGLYGSVKSADLAGKAAETAADSADDVAGVPASHMPAPDAAYVDIPLSGMRETIAKRLTSAKQSIPHYQLSMTINIDKTLAMRKAVNAKLEKEKADLKISVNDIIVKAMAAACKRVPAVNAYWMDTHIRQFSNVDVSVAVATPSGLITPIVFNADSRGVLDISRTVKELAQKAKDNKLQPKEYQGGTVTLSNLGMFGITMFNAIINPPQSLILACGGLENILVEDKDEERGFRVAKCITVTASADHRVIDGAVGAQWMKALKENLEDPVNIIL